MIGGLSSARKLTDSVAILLLWEDATISHVRFSVKVDLKLETKLISVGGEVN